jgi:type II secretory pathway component GspD/PulD (secretin)
MRLQSKVVAVADARTNSVIVSASAEVMKQIGRMVEKLDSDSARKQKVFVYSLEHADVDNVAGILRGMFQSQTTSRNNNSTSGNNVLQNRANTGATQNAGGGATRNNNNN